MQALPKALAKRGHRVMCIAPRYKNYDVRRPALHRVEGATLGAACELCRSCMNFIAAVRPVSGGAAAIALLALAAAATLCALPCPACRTLGRRACATA